MAAPFTMSGAISGAPISAVPVSASWFYVMMHAVAERTSGLMGVAAKSGALMSMRDKVGNLISIRSR